jgi:hypothetical protein
MARMTAGAEIHEEKTGNTTLYESIADLQEVLGTK